MLAADTRSQNKGACPLGSKRAGKYALQACALTSKQAPLLSPWRSGSRQMSVADMHHSSNNV